MNSTATLTKRENEIAEMIAWGATKKDVANILSRSARTVENQVRSIYYKTGVTKSNELSAWWFCTKFKISFSLSPLKTRVLAIILLIIIIPNELMFNRDMLRTFRSKKVSSRVGTSRRRGDEDSCICLFDI